MNKKIISLFFLCFSTFVTAEPLQIVAAENFYGNLAKQIGGPYVQVVNILNNPKQDPHLFSSTPSTARALERADLVIYNGLNYDPWMLRLLAPHDHSPKAIIVVAELINKKQGDNPHIWYAPNTMMVYATVLANKLGELDSTHKDYFQQQLGVFKQGHQAMLDKISTLKKQYQGAPVIASESVFNYMAEALGLNVLGQGFQLSITNEASPKISDIQSFESELNQKLAKVFIFNNQVANPLVEKMKALAIKNGIPVFGVSEIQPPDQDYLTWMEKELDVLDAALAKRQ